jgi:hypothetical protein
VIRLKNILLESKVGHLVEKEGDDKPKSKFKARSKETGELRYFSDKEKMDKAIKAGTVEPLDKKDKTSDTKKPNVDFAKDDKPKSKKDQEKAQKAADKKAKKELDNIKNTTIVVKEPGKADRNIAIKNILMPPFGDAKDNNHPEAEAAKKKVYEKYKEERVKEAKKEINSRLKKKGKDGQPLLTKEEKVLYDEKVKQAKEFGFDDPPTKEEFLEEKITNEFTEKVNYYNPDLAGFGGDTFWDKQEAGKDPFGDDGEFDFGDDDDDFDFDDDFGDAKTDDYGQKLSSLGDKRQKSALELKMGLKVGQLTKVKKAPGHRVNNLDGNPVQVSVFQDPETKKYYGITDEGDIYESDSEDFRNIKEPTTDARGYDGAVTKKGQSVIDKRAGKQKESEYDSTSFADLLDLLGIDTDIDYTNPFAAD